MDEVIPTEPPAKARRRVVSLERLPTGQLRLDEIDIRLMGFASSYATNLEDMVEDLAPALHGHTHVAREYVVGAVPVVSNSLGRGPGHHFRRNYVVEIADLKPAEKPGI